MHLHHQDDPRDSLSRARRRELVSFAHAHGLTHITEDMPADDYPDGSPGIRSQLRQRGLTNIKIPPRPLGVEGRHVIPSGPKSTAAPQPAANGTLTVTPEQLNAMVAKAVEAALQGKEPRPHRTSKIKGRVRLVERPKSEINKLRDECKRLGIKMDRRDRTDDLRRKIEAHHGQNAASGGQ